MQSRQSFLLFSGNHLPWFLTIVSFTKQLAQLLKPAKGAIRCDDLEPTGKGRTHLKPAKGAIRRDDLEPTGKGRTQMMGNQTQMLGNLLIYIYAYFTYTMSLSVIGGWGVGPLVYFF